MFKFYYFRNQSTHTTNDVHLYIKRFTCNVIHMYVVYIHTAWPYVLLEFDLTVLIVLIFISLPK